MHNRAKIRTVAALTTGILLSTTAFTATAEPPNTIDLNREFSERFTPTDYAIAVQSSGAPQEYTQEVVPSTRAIVAGQLSEYEQSQLTPAQLKRLKQIEIDRQRVEANPYLTLPNPVVRSISPDLSPGISPPVIRVSKNILTSIVFTDLDGNPWLIEKVMLNRGQFDDSAGVNGDGEPTNILTLEPNQPIEYGNVTVILKGKTLPVIFLLASGQPDVDVRLDVRMKGVNPDVPTDSLPIGINATSADIDDAALSFLDGTIPSEAEMLLSSDPAVRAWSYNSSVYIKTSLDVLYPAYQSRAKSPDGTNIYRFDNDPSSLTLMQRGGQPVTINLSQMPYQYDR